MARRSIYLVFLIAVIFTAGFGCPGNSKEAAIGQVEKTATPPPTTEPTISPDYHAPVFIPVPNQILSPGSEMTEVDLSSYVFEIDPESDVVAWSGESSDDLSITFDGPRMQVRRTTSDWSGIQTVRVEACNPGNLCGHVDIGFNLIGLVENGIMHTQVDGVIIEVGDVKIMIDALFISPSGTAPIMEEAMSAAAPPYDGADLILATHHHGDHFDPGIVVSYLINNPKARFVSTDVAVQRLAREEDFDLIAERVTGFHLEKGESTSLTVSGVDLEIMFISHGDDENIPNFAYLFRLGDQTFFHIGDIVLDSEPVETLQAYGLPEKDIDFAFVPYFMLTVRAYSPYALEGINARFLVPVHVSTEDKRYGTLFDSAEGNFESVISFRQDYSWYSFEKDSE